MNTAISDVAADAERLAASRQRVLDELRKAIVGQDAVIDLVLTALFTGGHCLLTGVPGLAKTHLIKSLAQILDLQFKRIQFTPDLMPADITGTEILEESGGHRSLTFVEGPIFAQVVLADEINRTPPKTQAALLEAMQEFHVTAAGRTYPLQRPFFVLATQNPIELEGTYPLPEAQLDRFMFQVWVDYPDEDEEFEIVKRTTSDVEVQITPTLNAEEIASLSKIIRKVPIADHVARYALQLARHSRPNHPDAPEVVKKCVTWGAGPRASQYLVLGAKARAVLHGRFYVSHEDIEAVAKPVLRHRIKRNFFADAEGVDGDGIVEQLIEATEFVSDGNDSGNEPEVFRSADAG